MDDCLNAIWKTQENIGSIFNIYFKITELTRNARNAGWFAKHPQNVIDLM